MNDALIRLAAFPSHLQALIESVSPELRTTRPKAGGFSLVEHAWHIAELEEEGYGARLARLLREDDPFFADFDGERIARERNYIAQPLAPALERFARTRAANVATIAAASESDWARSGRQEGAGAVTFARLVEMMGEHDAAHTAELQELLRELTA